MTDEKYPLPLEVLLGFADLDAYSRAYDDLVAQTADVDGFCSSSDWVLPARSAFARDARPFVMAAGESAVALMRIDAESGHDIALPLEAGWGLASGLVGPNAQEQAELLRHMVDREPHPPDALFLSGIARHGEVEQALIRCFAGRYRIGTGPVAGRRSTSIVGGVDGFLGRRKAKFRSNLRRARRKAEDGGLRFDYARGCEDTVDRLMRIEARSWKGLAGQGVDSGAPREFYDQMLTRLIAADRLRIVWVIRGAEDVAYCVGGLFGDAYRGLQVSFVDGCERWSAGNLAQLAMIHGLAEDGIETYHLGMEIPYKSRWAEAGLSTITLALLPS